MPFSRPTLGTIIDRIKSDFETRLDTGKLIPNSFLSIMASAYGGAVHLLHGHIVWAVNQLFPDTAEKEYLERWASIWGVKRASATFSSGTVTFTGTNGTIIPEGTRLKRSDDELYKTTSSGTISGGSASINVQPVNAGSEANADAGVALELTNNIAGIETAITVAVGGITGGADKETDDSLRQRTIERIQTPPHGGNKNDYVTWAKEILGVTRVWVYPIDDGAGTVNMTFVKDGEATPIPTSGDVLEVQNYIDRDDKKPVTANVTVFAPVADVLDFTIEISPDTAEIREAVEQSVKDMLLRESEPAGTIYISKIREAVSIATGENNNIVTIPSADVTHAAGHMAVMGVITWT